MVSFQYPFCHGQYRVCIPQYLLVTGFTMRIQTELLAWAVPMFIIKVAKSDLVENARDKLSIATISRAHHIQSVLEEYAID